MTLDKKLGDFDYASSLEWLETNGLGGYASSTVSGANTRRYHGLLVAAMQPPVGRLVVLSKLDETLVVNAERFDLSSNQYPGAVHPKGFQYLQEFNRDLFPEFNFSAGGIQLKKTIAAIHGENTTVVLYEVVEALCPFTLELIPLSSCRDFHKLSHANDAIGRPYLFDQAIFRTMNYPGCPEVFIAVPKAEFIENQTWYYNVEYAAEQYRGLEFKEDLYSHGKFLVELKKGHTLGIIISTENPQGKNAFKLFEKERKRRENLVADFLNNNLRKLVLAADQFIVKRGKLSTIIAGYPWFADWGRDTMISIPGLCLATGRFKEAKEILLQFSKMVREGMLPNRFPDYGETLVYNTIDATLWFFNAIYKYYAYTKDKAFLKSILPLLNAIVDWHYKGTRYHIKVDPSDELLSGGEEGVQLTWMDAKVGGWVVTPRRGKCVEINALWYNALCIMETFLNEMERFHESVVYQHRAKKVLKSFHEKFWNEKRQYLYDFIDGDHKNDDLRPNQLYALSLPFKLIDKVRAKKLMKVVSEHLLTPRGLRSLSPTHPDFKPVYGGDVWSRDGAYHQGTVWSFLLGPYVDALIYCNDEKGKSEATRLMSTFFDHFQEAGINTVSEIFDGAEPYTSRGCIAQAWGVAEVLRVITEYKLLA